MIFDFKESIFVVIELTGMQWQNTINDICASRADFCAKLKNFFLTQLSWIYTQIDSHPNDEYWHQVYAKKRKDFFLNSFDCLDKFTSCSIERSH